MNSPIAIWRKELLIEQKRNELNEEEHVLTLWANCLRIERESAQDMPTTTDALRHILRAQERLRKLGWRDARYAPSGAQPCEIVEAGSTGIHHATKDAQGRWWISDNHDLYPSIPLMYRPIPHTMEPS